MAYAPDAQEKSLTVVAELIPAVGHALIGATYTFLDDTKGWTSAVHYFIEDVDSYGRTTRHGSVVVEGNSSSRGRFKVDRKAR